MNAPSSTFRTTFSLKSIRSAYRQKICLKSTKGIDKIGLPAFEKNKELHFKTIYRKCSEGDYKFSPYLEKLKSKGKGKFPRVISIATTRDRIVLYLLKVFLHEQFSECVNRILPNSYIKELYSYIENNAGDAHKLCYYKTDIKGFYDNINKELLINFLGMKIKSKKILNLLCRAINNPIVPGSYKRKERRQYKTTKGIPQGLAISNILANIYLYYFDKILVGSCIKYFRYVDDIVLIVLKEKKNIKRQKRIIDKYIDETLLKFSLKRNEDKTGFECINTSFDFLGYTFQYPILTVRESSIKRFIQSIASIVTSFNYQISQKVEDSSWPSKTIMKQKFISDLNEHITGAISENRRYGWIFYYLEMNDLALLHQIDVIIKSFFKRIKEYNYEVPIELKSITKSFYKAKYDPLCDYIHNYDKFETISKKINYLENVGAIKPNYNYSEADIEKLFLEVRNKHLSKLYLDVGRIS